MRRFLVSWVVILALVLSGCGETAVSSGVSGGADSQQSAATETDAAEAETTEQTAEQSAEDDAEETADSETVLVNLVTSMYGDEVKATYTYDNSGNTTSAVYAYTTYSDYTETYYYTYNEAGNLAEQDYIYEVSLEGETAYGTETKSEYDADGKIVSEEIINFYSNSDGEETTPYGVFVYNYDGNVGTATATVQSDGETYTETRTVTYNGEGLLLSKEVYDEGEDNSYYPSRMTYDEAGRIICMITMMPSSYGTIVTYSYTNDSQGNLLTYSQKIEQGEYEGETDALNYIYYEYSYNEENEIETISKYSSQGEGGTLTLNGIRTYRYHYLDNELLSSVDGYDEDGDQEEDLFYFEYEVAVRLPADEAEAVQEAQTDRIRAFLRGELS